MRIIHRTFLTGLKRLFWLTIQRFILLINELLMKKELLTRILWANIKKLWDYGFLMICSQVKAHRKLMIGFTNFRHSLWLKMWMKIKILFGIWQNGLNILVKRTKGIPKIIGIVVKYRQLNMLYQMSLNRI